MHACLIWYAMEVNVTMMKHDLCNCNCIVSLLSNRIPREIVAILYSADFYIGVKCVNLSHTTGAALLLKLSKQSPMSWSNFWFCSQDHAGHPQMTCKDAGHRLWTTELPGWWEMYLSILPRTAQPPGMETRSATQCLRANTLLPLARH